MSVRIPVADFDRLSQAHNDLMSCTYLLYVLEEYGPCINDSDFGPQPNTYARTYIYEHLLHNLHEMQPALESAVWHSKKGTSDT